MIPICEVTLDENLKLKLRADPNFRTSAALMGALKLVPLTMLSGIQQGLDRRHHGFGPTYEMLYSGFVENDHFLEAFNHGEVVLFTLELYGPDSIEVRADIKNSSGEDLFFFQAVFEGNGSGGIVGSVTLNAQKNAA